MAKGYLENTFNIYFSGEEGKQGTPQSPVDGNVQNPAEPTKPKDKDTGGWQVAMVAFGVSMAQKSFSYAVSNIGYWTGDSYKQEQINFAMKAVGYGTAIAMGGVAGAAYVAFDLVTTGINEIVKHNRAMRDLEVVQARSGLAIGRN